MNERDHGDPGRVQIRERKHGHTEQPNSIFSRLASHLGAVPPPSLWYITFTPACNLPWAIGLGKLDPLSRGTYLVGNAEVEYFKLLPLLDLRTTVSHGDHVDQIPSPDSMQDAVIS